MRRILSRAAVVLGGVAAGWLLSTASASASAELDHPEVVQSTMDVLTVPGQVEHAVQAVLPEPPAPPAELGQVGRQVQGAVQQVTSHLSLPPVPSTKDVADEVSPARVRLLTSEVPDASPVVAPRQEVPSSPSAGSPARSVDVATHDYGRQPATEPVGRVALSNDAPELPAPVKLPLPLAPPTAPTGSCTTSCGHGSDDDLGTPVAHTWPNPTSGTATSRALRMMSQHVATAMGEQPGVTPD